MMGPSEVVRNYWGMESKRDLAGVLGCYMSDAELVVPELGKLVGHAEIQGFYEASFARFPWLQVQIVSEVVQGQAGAFEWESVFEDRAGERFPLRGVNVVEVEGDQLAVVHVYYDPSSLAGGRGEEAWADAGGTGG